MAGQFSNVGFSYQTEGMTTLHEMTAEHNRRTLHQNQIIRYPDFMRTVTATEASRNFKKLLDEVEAGESISITRGGVTIAEVTPIHPHTGDKMADALAELIDPNDPPISKERYDEWGALLADLRTYHPEDFEGAWPSD